MRTRGDLQDPIVHRSLEMGRVTREAMIVAREVRARHRKRVENGD